MKKKFIKDLKRFSLYNLVYKNMKKWFYSCLLITMIIFYLAIYYIKLFEGKGKWSLITLILLLISCGIVYLVLNYRIKKYIEKEHEEIEFSYFNNEFFLTLEKRN